MRTYSSGSGTLRTPGASQYPISPPPMKSVTNSNRRPFHVYKNGHDDGFRSSSAIVIVPAREVSAWRTPDGHRTRTTSALVRRPSPNTTFAGATDGVAPEIAEEVWAIRRPRQKIQQAVVVVIQELRGGRVGGGGRRGDHGEAAAAVAQGQ